MSASRSRVLEIFKKLHKTRKTVFEGDTRALAVAREKINSEFRKNVGETDSEKIKEHIKVASDAELVLRTTIVQAKLTERGTYAVKMRKDIPLEDNIPFDPNADIPVRKQKRKTKFDEEPS